MYKIKILSSNYITHDVMRFVLERPKELVYRPGESAHISLNLPSWEDKKRKFTFSSLNDWPFLEFIVKIYKERDGVTNKMSQMKSGEEFILHDVFGSIKYRGAGIFIAGGTGITPFLAIFRALYLTRNLNNTGLIYSNKGQRDVILHDELVKMLGPAYMNVFTRQGVIGFREHRIDREFLINTISNFNGLFYVCGPKDFTEEISEELISLGAKAESLIV